MNQILLILLAAIAVLVAAVLILDRPQLMRVDATPPIDFPEAGFAHDALEKLLQKYVDANGKVDYGAWHANAEDRTQLNAYLAAVAAYSPENAPHRFAGTKDALAYWMYGYNAYVIWSILENYPLKSVTDIKAPLELVTGLGFFYRQRFLFGETAYSLYAVENDRIRADFKDPRIHFVLNCASESCPVLRPELPVGTELESLLAEAAIDFVHDEKNVRVDHLERTIYLSTIFRWFRKDFENDLRRRGLPFDNGPLDYVIDLAAGRLHESLGKAADYDVVYQDYDWRLNQQDSP